MSAEVSHRRILNFLFVSHQRHFPIRVWGDNISVSRCEMHQYWRRASMWHKATRRPPLAIGTARTNDDKERERTEERERVRQSQRERDDDVLRGLSGASVRALAPIAFCMLTVSQSAIVDTNRRPDLSGLCCSQATTQGRLGRPSTCLDLRVVR